MAPAQAFVQKWRADPEALPEALPPGGHEALMRHPPPRSWRGPNLDQPLRPPRVEERSSLDTESSDWPRTLGWLWSFGACESSARHVDVDTPPRTIIIRQRGHHRKIHFSKETRQHWSPWGPQSRGDVLVNPENTSLGDTQHAVSCAAVRDEKSNFLGRAQSGEKP